MFLISILSCTTTGTSPHTSCSACSLLSAAMMACMISARLATLVALTSSSAASPSQSMVVEVKDKARGGEIEVFLLLLLLLSTNSIFLSLRAQSTGFSSMIYSSSFYLILYSILCYYYPLWAHCRNFDLFSLTSHEYYASFVLNWESYSTCLLSISNNFNCHHVN